MASTEAMLLGEEDRRLSIEVLQIDLGNYAVLDTTDRNGTKIACFYCRLLWLGFAVSSLMQHIPSLTNLSFLWYISTPFSEVLSGLTNLIQLN